MTHTQLCYVSAYVPARNTQQCSSHADHVGSIQVDSPDSLENVESKWVGEILENCPGVELVLVALKCDLRPSPGEEDEEENEAKRPTLTYHQGLEVAKRIRALRYLGECSSWVEKKTSN